VSSLDPASPDAPRPKKKRGFFGKLGMFFLWAFLLGVVAMVAILLFAPINWITQNQVLPIARTMLDHDEITIGNIDGSPLTGFEIREIRVGPPKGYREDIVNVGRVAFYYDLTDLLGRTLTLSSVEVEDPHVFLELRDGKPNVQALLDALPGSEPTPSEPLDLPEFTVVLEKIRVSGVRAGFDDGAGTRATLGDVAVEVQGALHTVADSRLDVTVEVGPQETDTPNVHAVAPAVGGVEAALELATRTTVGVDVPKGLQSGRVEMNTDVRLKVHEVKAPYPVRPFGLTAGVEVKAEGSPKAATLHTFAARLGDEEVTRLSARVPDLSTLDFDLHVEHATVPAKAFSELVRNLLPVGARFDLVGKAGVKDLKVAGRVPDLTAGALPVVSLAIAAEGFGVDVDTGAPIVVGAPIDVSVPRVAGAVSGIGAAFDVALSPKAKPLGDQLDAVVARADATAVPSVLLRGRALVGEARAPDFARLDDPDAPLLARVADVMAEVAVAVDLDTTAAIPAPTRVAVKTKSGIGTVEGFGATVRTVGADATIGAALSDNFPTWVELQAAADVGGVSAVLPGLGSLGVRAGGGVDMRAEVAEQSVTVRRFDGRVAKLGAPGDIIAARGSAEVLKLGQEGFRLDVDVDPIDLARALTLAPTGVRAQMPRGLKLGGTVATTVHIEGALPPLEDLQAMAATPTGPLALPVDLDIRSTLAGLRVALPSAGVSMRGLEGAVHIVGRPADLRVHAPDPLRIARIGHGPTKAAVEGITIPFDLRLQPRSSRDTVALSAGFSAKRIGAEVEAARVELGPLATGVKMAVGVPVARIAAGQRFDVQHINVDGLVELDTLEARLGPKRDLVVHLQTGEGQRGHALEQAFGFDYDPAEARQADGIEFPLGIRSETTILEIAVPRFDAAVRDIGYHQRIDIAGLTLAGLSAKDPLPKTKPRYIRLEGGLRSVDDDPDRSLTIEVDNLPVEGVIGRNRFDMAVLISIPRLRVPPLDPDLFAEIDAITIEKLDFHNESHGPNARMAGVVGPIIVPSDNLPPFRLNGHGGVKLPSVTRRDQAPRLFSAGTEAARNRMELRMAGSAGFDFRLRHITPGLVELHGAAVAENMQAWAQQEGFAFAFPDGTKVYVDRVIHMDDLDARVPVVQRIRFATIRDLVANPHRLEGILANLSRLHPAARDIRSQGRTPVYKAMRPYSAAPANVTLERLGIDQTFNYYLGGEKIDEAKAPLSIDAVAADVSYEDWVLDVRSYAMEVLDGDLDGRLALRLRSAQPPDVDLSVHTQVTGADLARLNWDARRGGRAPQRAEISFDSMLDLGLKNRDLDGHVHVSQASLAQLDELLKFIDPAKRNNLIQEQRRLINSYTVREIAAPTVRYVHMELNHSSLDLETAFDGTWGVRHALNTVMENVRISNIDVRELVDNILTQRADKTAWRRPPPVGEPPENVTAEKP
jgi:hypothetical protein